MIITKSKPFIKDEIEKLKEQFDVYVKTVIDVEKGICSAGADKIVDCNSFINVRPADNNMSNEIQDPKLRKKFEDLTRYFFEELL